jgi:hypothetical protein
MNKIITRSIKTSESAERPSIPIKFLKKRGSFDNSDKPNLNLSSSMSNYNDQFPPFNAQNKVFSSTKASESPLNRKSHKSSSVSKCLQNNLDSIKPETFKFWEVSERIESLEIRISKNPETSPASKLHFWKNCCAEVVSLIKSESVELGNAVQRLVKGSLLALDEVCLEFSLEKARFERNFKEISEVLKGKDLEIEKLNKEIRGFKSVKLEQDWKINSQIKELFEELDDDEEEVKQAKIRCEKLLKTKNNSLVPLLQEIHENLRKGRDNQEYLDPEFDQPNPDDISNALKFNFNLILKASTKKAMKLLRKDVKTKIMATQTMIACVSAEEYQDLMKKLEKSTISQQSLAAQLEKYRDDVIIKSQIAEKAEQDKNQAYNQIIKMRKEIESYLKENLNIKKDNEKLNNEKEKFAKELEMKNGLLIKTQEKLASTENKYKKILNKTAQPTHFINDLEKNDVFNKQPSEKEIVILNQEVVKYSTRYRPGMNSRKNSKSNIYEGKTLNYENFFNKSKNQNSNQASKTSLLDDYINSINQNPKTRKQSQVISQNSQNRRKSSVFSNENSPIHNRATDTDNRHENLERPNFSESKRKSIKINILQPEGSQFTEPDDETPVKNEKVGTSKTKAKYQENRRISMKNSGNNPKIEELEKGKQDKDVDISQKNTRVLEINGKSVVFVDESTNTIEKISTFCSIGLQCGGSSNEEEQKDLFGHLGIFHFNPNNFFGFKGDVFFNGNVFTAQPTMPDCPISLGKSNNL